MGKAAIAVEFRVAWPIDYHKAVQEWLRRQDVSATSCDCGCTVHGVCYRVFHGPGTYRVGDLKLDHRTFLSLTDATGKVVPPAPLQAEIDCIDESTLQIRTGTALAYPLTLRVVPA